MQTMKLAGAALCLVSLTGCVTVLLCNNDGQFEAVQMAVVSEGEVLGPATTLQVGACRRVMFVDPEFLRVNALSVPQGMNDPRQGTCTINVNPGDVIEANWTGSILRCRKVVLGP